MPIFCGDSNIEEGEEWIRHQISCNEVTDEASVLRTFGLYSNFMNDALFLKAQVILPGSIFN